MQGLGTGEVFGVLLERARIIWDQIGRAVVVIPSQGRWEGHLGGCAYAFCRSLAQCTAMYVCLCRWRAIERIDQRGDEVMSARVKGRKNSKQQLTGTTRARLSY